MKLLTERCPSCGGRLGVKVNSISCLSCDFSKDSLPEKVMKEILAKCEEFNPDISLTTAGKWSTEHDLHEWLDCRRIAQNLTEGYELRATDKLLLLEAGFASRVVVVGEQKEG